MKQPTTKVVLGFLEKCYDLAVEGAPGLDSAEELAEDYMAEGDSLYDKANSLIRWQVAKAGASGFVTNLGGLVTLPVALPANITSVMYIQVRMIAAIAHMGGWDIRDDRVKTLVFLCLVYDTAKDVAKVVAIQVGRRMITLAIKTIPGKVLTAINQRVGFRLVTKFGEKGVINLVKWVPLVGGVIGGGLDAAFTNQVGNVARDVFIGGAP